MNINLYSTIYKFGFSKVLVLKKIILLLSKDAFDQKWL